MGLEKQEITDGLPDGVPSGVPVTKPSGDALRAQAVSRRSLLAGFGLLLAACSGMSPALRQKNPFAEKLTPEEAEALEKLYAALEKLDQYIENFARDVANVNADKMTIEEAELLELRLNAIKKLLDAGLAVKVQLSEHRENFDQAANYLRQTVMKDVAEKYALVEQRVKMITESVYTKHMVALTDDNFEGEVLKNSDVCIVMVSADWCPSCHSALPLTAKFGRKGTGRVKIGRAVLENAEGNTVNPKMKAFFRSIAPGFPAYVVFIKGQPVGFRLGGLDSLGDFDLLVEKARKAYRKYMESQPPNLPPPQMEPDDTDPENRPKFTPSGPVIKA